MFGLAFVLAGMDDATRAYALLGAPDRINPLLTLAIVHGTTLFTPELPSNSTPVPLHAPCCVSPTVAALGPG